jgi:hypothetical protein
MGYKTIPKTFKIKGFRDYIFVIIGLGSSCELINSFICVFIVFS